MATVVNQPADSGNNGMGYVLAVIILILAIVFFFYYGLPFVRSNVGTGGTGGAQINVPNSIDVHTSK